MMAKVHSVVLTIEAKAPLSGMFTEAEVEAEQEYWATRIDDALDTVIRALATEKVHQSEELEYDVSEVIVFDKHWESWEDA